ncbi:MAG: hypothetical protein JO295_13115 [Verrucomicrobia bacterium]|nr:hypothetical protein [Verrucomicrobiota bacterium]
MPSPVLAQSAADLDFSKVVAAVREVRRPARQRRQGGEARAFVALGLTGLVLPLCHFVRPSPTVELGELTLFFTICLGTAGWCAWTNNGSADTAPLPSPPAATGAAKTALLPWAATLALCVLAGALASWAHGAGVSPRVAFGAGFVGLGALCTLAGAWDRTRRAWLGLGGSLTVLGLVWPTLPAGLWNSAFGLAFCAGGLSAAALLSRRTRQGDGGCGCGDASVERADHVAD